MDTSIYRNIYVTWHENFFLLSFKQIKENDSCESICIVCIYIYTQQYYSLLYLIVKYLFFTASVSILTCPEGDLT